MTSGSDWQGKVGQNWADMHAWTDRSFTGLTQHLLGRIALHPGHAVLDIGCGAGELSLAIGRARPDAQVIGLDISADLVAAARMRGGHHANVDFVVGDAGTWQRDCFTPDLLVSRHGVMFFDDPPAAFAHLRRIAAPGARLVFSCFRAPRENRWMTDVARLLDLPPPADPHAPGPFAFADPQRVEGILAAAGWADIDFEPVDFAYIAGTGPDPVSDAEAFFARIGPAAATLRELSGPALAETQQRIRTWLAESRSADLVAFSAAAWVVTARNG